MIAFAFLVALIALVLRPCTAVTYHNNSYDASEGCLQFDDALEYNQTPVYFATKAFRNVGRTNHSRYFRIGVMGKNDGHIRFGHSKSPFNEYVTELVLSGWYNTLSVARRQLRRRDHTYDNELLREVSTPGLLHRSRPLMFKLEVFDNYYVELTKDGEPKPFLQFSGSTVLPTYIAFLKFDVDMVYFYDCPLRNEPTATIGGNNALLVQCAPVSKNKGKN